MKLSLVIPTYNDEVNIKRFVLGILKEFKRNKISGEVILVDDGSHDDTADILDNLKRKNKNVRVLHRKGELNLSSAVLDGWKIAQGSVLGVINVDPGYPPQKIRELLWSIEKGGADFAIGSRYVRGGKVIGRSLGRNAMSRVASLFARVLTNVRDPATNFFMIRKECIDDVELDPHGFKILLEVLIKGRHKKIKEIPITFSDSSKQSKISLEEILFYMRNIFSYAYYHKQLSREFGRFLLAGLLGTMMNLGILYFLTDRLGMYYLISAVFSYILAVIGNFFLNKVLTFKERLGFNIGRKFLKFVSVSLVALSMNLVFLFLFTDVFGIYYVISQFLAIALSSFINFFGHKVWTFSD